MAKALVTDELWEVVEPLLPEEPPKPKGGRPRVDDRAALTGILFILKSGIPWEMLPQEIGCGSDMTCWRRLKEWHEAGVWERLHKKGAQDAHAHRQWQAPRSRRAEDKEKSRRTVRLTQRDVEVLRSHRPR